MKNTSWIHHFSMCMEFCEIQRILEARPMIEVEMMSSLLPPDPAR